LQRISDATHQTRYKQLNNKRNILITKLSNTKLKAWNNWTQTIDAQIQEGLDSNLMSFIPVVTLTEKHNPSFSQRAIYNSSGKSKSTETISLPNVVVNLFKNSLSTLEANHSEPTESKNNFLQINLSSQLFSLLKETKYIFAMQNAFTGEPQQNQEAVLPSNLINLYAKRDQFWERQIKLIKISEYYNTIKEDVSSNSELELVANEVDSIESSLWTVCNTMTWRLYGKQMLWFRYLHLKCFAD